MVSVIKVQGLALGGIFVFWAAFFIGLLLIFSLRLPAGMTFPLSLFPQALYTCIFLAWLPYLATVLCQAF